jgi:hypothetical protein
MEAYNPLVTILALVAVSEIRACSICLKLSEERTPCRGGASSALSVWTLEHLP